MYYTTTSYLITIKNRACLPISADTFLFSVDGLEKKLFSKKTRRKEYYPHYTKASLNLFQNRAAENGFVCENKSVLLLRLGTRTRKICQKAGTVIRFYTDFACKFWQNPDQTNPSFFRETTHGLHLSFAHLIHTLQRHFRDTRRTKNGPLKSLILAKGKYLNRKFLRNVKRRSVFLPENDNFAFFPRIVEAGLTVSSIDASCADH